ncbi:MAG: hypothetical protein WC119_01965 [Synergistaceae bacterium]
MAIVYYPNRLQKKLGSAIDRVMAKRTTKLVQGSQDVTTEALNAVISAETDWQINNIAFAFSNATSRNYSAKVMNGRKVVDSLNDSLWFQHADSLPQEITLDSGFYTGTELAAELKTQLDANDAFTSLGVTFTVVYAEATGKFTITPSSGNIRYLNVNSMTVPRYKDSIAGHLFGLNADTEFASSITSDTDVFGLDSETWIIDETGSVVTEHFNDDDKVLNIDQAIHLASNTASVRIDYAVNYELLN